MHHISFDKIKWLFDSGKWICEAILLPVFGFIWFFIRRVWNNKRKRRSVINAINGLPLESKRVLYLFYKNRSQSLDLDPVLTPGFPLLHQRGFLINNGAGGDYFKLNRNFTIGDTIWEAMMNTPNLFSMFN